MTLYCKLKNGIYNKRTQKGTDHKLGSDAEVQIVVLGFNLIERRVGGFIDISYTSDEQNATPLTLNCSL
jgi:hypothetical protein